MKFILLLIFVSSKAYAQDLKDFNTLSIIKMIDNVLDLTTDNGGDISKSDVNFLLYTRNNPLTFIHLSWDNMQLVNSSKPIKFIIHGWLENYNRTWYKNMKDEFLKFDDYTVIQVDWQKPASFSYAVAASNTRLVGTIISQFIVGLVKNIKIPWENFHVIGHSLGAHIAGFAGQNVYRSTGMKIHRISGLDPAGPLFENILISKYNRLNDEDAEIVDVIHTDGGVFGFVAPIGTIDFYPNGGTAVQPGCLMAVQLTTFGNFLDGIFCSHMKSHKYFTEAINNGTFKATQCSTYYHYLARHCNGSKMINVKVEDITSSMKGTYYFKTRNQPPYLI